MTGGGGPGKKGTFKMVRYVTLDEDKLKKLADLLGIPAAERDDLSSGEIHIVPTKSKSKKSKKTKP
jgi:hypothetical protein